MTVAVPLGRGYAVKASYSGGVITKSGASFNSFLMSLQKLF